MKNLGAWSESVMWTDAYCEKGHVRNLRGVTQERKIIMFFTHKERKWLVWLQWRIRLEVREFPCVFNSDQSPSGQKFTVNQSSLTLHLVKGCNCSRPQPKSKPHYNVHACLCYQLNLSECFLSALIFRCTILRWNSFRWNETIRKHLWCWYEILTELLRS